MFFAKTILVLKYGFVLVFGGGSGRGARRFKTP
jgi:hypothetical protein